MLMSGARLVRTRASRLSTRSLTAAMPSDSSSRTPIAATPFQVRAMATYDEAPTEFAAKQTKLRRPTSPHVLIYDFPLAALTSITHRVSGGILALGMYDVAICSLLGLDSQTFFLALHDSFLAVPAKFAVSGAVIFHAIGGIRHLYWDAFPEGLSPESQKSAALGVLGSSFVLSTFVALW